MKLKLEIQLHSINKSLIIKIGCAKQKLSDSTKRLKNLRRELINLSTDEAFCCSFHRIKKRALQASLLGFCQRVRNEPSF